MTVRCLYTRCFPDQVIFNRRYPHIRVRSGVRFSKASLGNYSHNWFHWTQLVTSKLLTIVAFSKRTQDDKLLSDSLMNYSNELQCVKCRPIHVQMTLQICLWIINTQDKQCSTIPAQWLLFKLTFLVNHEQTDQTSIVRFPNKWLLRATSF